MASSLYRLLRRDHPQPEQLFDLRHPVLGLERLSLIPQTMFDGVLTPTDKAYEPYTKTLDVFTAFIKPA